MKKNIIIILTILFCTSCDKYLDVKPYGKVVPKTAEEFSSLMHSRLYQLDNGTTNYFIDNASTLVSLDLVSGDDFEVCLTTSNGQYLKPYIGSLVGGSYGRDAYQKLYETIRDCNIVIGEMKEEGTSLSDVTRATAYALRGVCYYQLLRMYCEAPEKGKLEEQLGMSMITTFDVEARPIRSSMQTTVSQIEADLQHAISYHPNDELFRFTEDVCKGYLARLYFWTEQWDKVLPLTQELLKTYPILAIDSYEKGIKITGSLGTNQLIKAYRNSTSSDQDYRIGIQSLQYRPVSARFLSHFAVADTANDLRYRLFVSKNRIATKPMFCGLRSEEFLLMQAESCYHLGKEAEALAALNILRASRIKNVTAYTVDNLPVINPKEIIKVDAEGKTLTPLLAAILSERRKELFLEGDRFFELKRNGTPEFWSAFNARKYTTYKYMYTFPIPYIDMQTIDGMQQNTGYTELVSL